MSMQPYVVVLAGSVQEGRTYARRKGLVLSRCRIVANASSVRGLRQAEIHELPSFNTRLDRHAINAQLRFVRGGERIQVTMPALAEAPPVDQGDGMGQQLTIEDALGILADEDQRIADVENTEPESEEPDGEQTGEAEQSEDAAPPEEKPKATRRRRCPDCGVLVPDLDAHTCAPPPSEFF